MTRYVILAILAASSSFANPTAKQENLESIVQRVLPGTVQKLQPGKTTQAEAEKLLGAPLKDSTSAERFYNLSENTPDNSDLTIGIKQDKIRYFYYKLPTATNQNFPLSSFKPFFSKSTLKNAQKKLRQQAARPDSGKTFDVQIPEQGLLLKFHLAEEPTLSAVLKWNPAEKMP